MVFGLKVRVLLIAGLARGEVFSANGEHDDGRQHLLTASSGGIADVQREKGLANGGFWFHTSKKLVWLAVAVKVGAGAISTLAGSGLTGSGGLSSLFMG